MNIYSIYIPEPYLFYALGGQVKTIVELDKTLWNTIEAGDLVSTRSGEFVVTAVSRFKELEDLVANIGVRNIYPDKANYEEAKSYFSILFSEAEVESFGLIAISIEKKR